MRVPICLVLMGALATAACSGTDGPDPTTTTSTTTTVATRVDDKVLRIGVLLPSSGAGLEIGLPTIDGVRLAIGEINAAGGVNGANVEMIVRDEGDDAVVASRSLEQLVRAGVDAVIGPASSKVALSVLSDVVSAGIVACSPTATSLALDDFPDDDLFFRTVPSDSLAAIAIARAVEATGRNPIAVTYLDDSWGRPIAAAIESALRARGIEIAASVPFTSSDDNLSTAAAAVTAVGPGVVAVVGDADTTLRMASAVNTSASPTVVVTDAARRPSSLNLIESMSPSTRSRIVGVSPSASPSAELLQRLQRIRSTSTGLYASNSYDCTNLIALSALVSGGTDPRAIAGQMSQVSTSGSSCADFAGCAALIDNDRNIDYDGPTSISVIGSTGDPTSARFDRFGFDGNGRDRTLAVFTVTI